MRQEKNLYRYTWPHGNPDSTRSFIDELYQGPPTCWQGTVRGAPSAQPPNLISADVSTSHSAYSREAFRSRYRQMKGGKHYWLTLQRLSPRLAAKTGTTGQLDFYMTDPSQLNAHTPPAGSYCLMSTMESATVAERQSQVMTA